MVAPSKDSAHFVSSAQLIFVPTPPSWTDPRLPDTAQGKDVHGSLVWKTGRLFESGFWKIWLVPLDFNITRIRVVDEMPSSLHSTVQFCCWKTGPIRYMTHSLTKQFCRNINDSPDPHQLSRKATTRRTSTTWNRYRRRDLFSFSWWLWGYKSEENLKTPSFEGNEKISKLTFFKKFV